MSLARQVRLLLGLLLTIQVLTSLAAIALIERMSPAIGAILADNVASVEAVDVMLETLARRDVDEVARARFMTALAAAENNVTDAEEPTALVAIRRGAPAALDGDALARERVIHALTQLADVNHAAMERANAQATQLGMAGRWGLAFLALVGLGLSVVALRRSRAQILDPVAELVTVARARAAGDAHRRCAVTVDHELSEVLAMVNGLLDAADRPRRDESDTTEWKAALVAVLDHLDAPVVLVDAEGAPVAASARALDRLSEAEGDLLEAVRAAGPDEAVDGVEPITGTALRLVRLGTDDGART